MKERAYKAILRDGSKIKEFKGIHFKIKKQYGRSIVL